MMEVQCPQCQQFWYTDDEEGGRLCSACIDQLRTESKSTQRRNRRGRHFAEEKRKPGFFFYYLLSIGIGVPLLMGLALLWPTVFGPVVIVVGGILSLGGLILLRRVNAELSRIDQVGEWWGGHYFAVAAIAGICCIVFFFKTIKPELARIAIEKREQSTSQPPENLRQP